MRFIQARPIDASKPFNLDRGRAEIEANRNSLSPGRYINNELEDIEDELDFSERVQVLADDLETLFAKSNRLQGDIQASLEQIGFGDPENV